MCTWHQAHLRPHAGIAKHSGDPTRGGIAKRGGDPTRGGAAKRIAERVLEERQAAWRRGREGSWMWGRGRWRIERAPGSAGPIARSARTTSSRPASSSSAGRCVTHVSRSRPCTNAIRLDSAIRWGNSHHRTTTGCTAGPRPVRERISRCRARAASSTVAVDRHLRPVRAGVVVATQPQHPLAHPRGRSGGRVGGDREHTPGPHQQVIHPVAGIDACKHRPLPFGQPSQQRLGAFGGLLVGALSWGAAIAPMDPSWHHSALHTPRRTHTRVARTRGLASKRFMTKHRATRADGRRGSPGRAPRRR